MNELKRCPFCGGEARFATDSKRFIECEKCGASTGYCESEEEAINAWNTRKPVEDVIERLEEESNFFRGEPMGTLQKAYYCMGIEKAIEIIKELM